MKKNRRYNMIVYGKNVIRGYEPTDSFGLRAEKALMDLGNTSALPNILDFLRADSKYGEDYGVHLAKNAVMHELAKRDTSSFEYAKEVCWVLNEVEHELDGKKVVSCKNYFVDDSIKNQIGSSIKNAVSIVVEKLLDAKKQFSEGYYIPGEYYNLLQKLDNINAAEVARALYSGQTTKLRRTIQMKVLKELNISDKYIQILVGENTYCNSDSKANTLSSRINKVSSYYTKYDSQSSRQGVKDHWVFQYTPKILSGWSNSYAHTYKLELRVMYYYIQKGLSLDDKLPTLSPAGLKKYTGTTKLGRSYTKYRIDGALFKKHFNLILAYYTHVCIANKYSDVDDGLKNFITSYNGSDELVRAIKMSI